MDVTSVSRRELRSRMGMVLQDAWLFGGSIRDNIAYGRPDATEAEILEAARATYVDRFVRSLPAGYDKVLEDEGSNVERAFHAAGLLVMEAGQIVEQGTHSSL